MNEIVSKFLLAGNKFMSKLHLRQPGFMYGACGLFTEHREKIQKFKETDNINYTCKNKFGEASFANDATYSNSEDLDKIYFR